MISGPPALEPLNPYDRQDVPSKDQKFMLQSITISQVNVNEGKNV